MAAIAAGRAVVVVDDEDRENEGDIVFAADAATPELVALTVRYTSGVLCAPMPGRVARPPGAAPDDGPQNEEGGGARRARPTPSAATRPGTTTGISAADRVHTLKVLADPASRPT